MKNSKNELWVYRVSTALLCSVLLLSAGSYFLHPPTIEGILELGFPDYFRIQLGILKILAGVTLLLPVAPVRCKEWAYAFAGFFFLTALVAHIAHKDPISISALLIFFFVLLSVSNHFFNKVVVDSR